MRWHPSALFVDYQMSWTHHPEPFSCHFLTCLGVIISLSHCLNLKLFTKYENLLIKLLLSDLMKGIASLLHSFSLQGGSYDWESQILLTPTTQPAVTHQIHLLLPKPFHPSSRGQELNTCTLIPFTHQLQSHIVWYAPGLPSSIISVHVALDRELDKLF